MNEYAVFLRGVNVGRSRRIDAAGLKAALCDADCVDVLHYIQSGNFVCRHKSRSLRNIAKSIEAAFEAMHGVDTRAFVVRRDALKQIISGNPYAVDEKTVSSCHVFFLESEPTSAALDKFSERLKPVPEGGDEALAETFVCVGTVLYLSAPQGLARSYVAGNADRLLGVATSARNWRTINKTMALFEKID